MADSWTVVMMLLLSSFLQAVPYLLASQAYRKERFSDER